jgi:hypothetical protein
MNVERAFSLSGGKGNTMTHIIMTYIAEALAVVLILLLGAAILAI